MTGFTNVDELEKLAAEGGEAELAKGLTNSPHWFAPAKPVPRAE